jgi:hypothetical protein
MSIATKPVAGGRANAGKKLPCVFSTQTGNSDRHMQPRRSSASILDQDLRRHWRNLSKLPVFAPEFEKTAMGSRSIPALVMALSLGLHPVSTQTGSREGLGVAWDGHSTHPLFEQTSKVSRSATRSKEARG